MKCAYVFPGQSSQRIGMLNALYKESNIVKRTFEEASDTIGYDIAKVCFEGSKAVLQDIAISAPIIVAAGIATYRHIQSHSEFSPALLAGHSLGEYTALSCAGVFSLTEVLPLVAYRSRLAQRIMSNYNGVMTVVIHSDELKMEEICKQMRNRGSRVWISSYNSTQQICIGGSEKDVEKVEQYVLRMGASYHRIKGTAPYHTPLMREAVDELAGFLKCCSMAPPKIPVIANVSTKPYTAFSVIENLLFQLQHPVRWHETIAYMKKQNTNTFIELGSGQILTRLIKSNYPDVQVFNYETAEDRNRMSLSSGSLAEVSA